MQGYFIVTVIGIIPRILGLSMSMTRIILVILIGIMGLDLLCVVNLSCIVHHASWQKISYRIWMLVVYRTLSGATQRW